MASLKKRAMEAVEAGGMHDDKVVGHPKDGRVDVKRSYFYHHGVTAVKWGEKVGAVLAEHAPDLCVVETRDEWRAWPKESFLVAVVSFVDHSADYSRNK